MNSELAKILNEISMLLEMKEVPFKPQAYEKASLEVASLSEEVDKLYKREGIKGLEKISGIGKGIAEKIEEYIKTGIIKDYEKLKKQVPVNLSELSSVEGVGPKRIYILYKKLGIKNIADLEKAAKSGEIRGISGFGEKTEQNILKHIDFFRKSYGRFTLGKALPLAKKIVERLKNLKEVKEAEFMGSIRRMQETVGDLDILVISDKPEAVMDFFTSMPEVAEIHSKGITRSSVKFNNKMNSDLRVVPSRSFGAALQYFTGDKQHNIELRKIAIKMGYKLNEYGLWKGNPPSPRLRKGKEELIAGKNEREIYEKLGLEWMPPELRTNSGEFQAAQTGKLPKLIDYSDLKGDLQIQTDWTDGNYSILEMAQAAGKYGLEYIAITDHTKSLAIANGNDEKKILKQMAEIDKIQSKISDVKILKGAEVNILKDGSLDIEDGVLAKLDVVGASVHSFFDMSEKDMTARIIKAIENPNVDILFHPTGRIVQKRKPYSVDIDKVIKAAKRTNTVLEVNSLDRLDLKDEHIKKAVSFGVKISIDSDSHDISHFSSLEIGIGQARRGWAEKRDVINTKDWEDMLKLLK